MTGNDHTAKWRDSITLESSLLFHVLNNKIRLLIIILVMSRKNKRFCIIKGCENYAGAKENARMFK